MLTLLGGAVVVYKSKRQISVALSSVETKYMTLALARSDVDSLFAEGDGCHV